MEILITLIDHLHTKKCISSTKKAPLNDEHERELKLFIKIEIAFNVFFYNIY